MDMEPARRRRTSSRSAADADRAPEVVVLSSSDSDSTAHVLTSQDAESDPAVQRTRRSIQRASLKDRKSSKSVSDATAVKAQATEWECPRCTYVNPASADVCEVCESAKAGQRKVQRMSQWLSTPAKQTRPPLPAKRREEPPVESIDSSSNSDDDFDSSTSRSVAPSCRAPATSAGLWVDSYDPKSIDELCVQKKKVQELSDWLQRNAMPSSLHSQQSVHPRKRLLFLCGPPGCGKSTAVECIARQFGIRIKEWHDNTATSRTLFREEYVSSADDFMDFMSRSVKYSALPTATVTSTRNRNMVPAKRKLQNGERADNTDRALLKPNESANQLILVQNWPQSASSNKESSAEQKLQGIFKLLVDPSANPFYPVICIYSDVRESKIDIGHLGRVFSDAVMQSPFTTVLSFNAVTSAQLKKNLLRVADKEKSRIRPTDLENIIDDSMGDLRHAINMLQVLQNRDSSVTRKMPKANAKKQAPGSNSEGSSAKRDPFFSDFHIVGKLLNGKLVKSKSATESKNVERVDYDQLLDAVDLPLEKVLSLVHENCVDFFTQIEDLGDAMELMSFSENMIAASYKAISSSEAFLRTRQTARAVVIRTVALTNAHPAPKAFRPITRARTYAVREKMLTKREELSWYTQEGRPSLATEYNCRGDLFATEIQPFVSLIDRYAPPVASPPNQDLIQSSAAAMALQPELEDEIESDGDQW